MQEFSYNLQNWPVMQKGTYGNRTEFTYGPDGMLRNVRRPGDGSWNDSAGDGSGHSGVMAQNSAAGQSASSGQRVIQQYEYNAMGQSVGVVDGNLNPISYDVDSWGRITGMEFADGVREGYEYTPAGQVSRTTDGNGSSVQYRYNSLSQVSERTDQLGYTETVREHSERDRGTIQSADLYRTDV